MQVHILIGAIILSINGAGPKNFQFQIIGRIQDIMAFP